MKLLRSLLLAPLAAIALWVGGTDPARADFCVTYLQQHIDEYYPYGDENSQLKNYPDLHVDLFAFIDTGLPSFSVPAGGQHCVIGLPCCAFGAKSVPTGSLLFCELNLLDPNDAIEVTLVYTETGVNSATVSLDCRKL